jgi:hypothetical protein
MIIGHASVDSYVRRNLSALTDLRNRAAMLSFERSERFPPRAPREVRQFVAVGLGQYVLAGLA